MSWYAEFRETVNTGECRSIILHGETSDLQKASDKNFLQLVPMLLQKIEGTGYIPLVCELNGPIRTEYRYYELLKRTYDTWKSLTTVSPTSALGDLLPSGRKEAIQQESFNAKWSKATGNPSYALELLRQLCAALRWAREFGEVNKQTQEHKLMIFVEAADFLLPTASGDVARLNHSQFLAVSVIRDWISDAKFIENDDVLCLVGDSISNIHPTITTMPQVKSIEVSLPDLQLRTEYLKSFYTTSSEVVPNIAASSAGMSLYSLRRLLVKHLHLQSDIRQDDIVEAVANDITTRLGPGVVEFKKPKHKLEDVVGFNSLKNFIKDELILRFQAPKDQCLTGAAVAGPIGSGKTFIFEAVAAELDVPVLVLKNIRSQWYGQTDVVFEKLQRVLSNLDKVLIFVDEADTQFGGVGKDVHETERRLTGKLQSLMSDSAYKGKVFWLLMTARIDQLSPDLRRPGRAGDLIIPVLDPEGEDRDEFIRWILPDASDEIYQALNDHLSIGFSSAGFASIRSYFNWKKPKTKEEVISIVKDIRMPPFQQERRMQTIQAILNCTRKSLLPADVHLDKLEEEYRKLSQDLV